MIQLRLAARDSMAAIASPSPWLDYIARPSSEGAIEQLESESERREPKTPRERTDPEFWQKQLAKTRADDAVRYTERLIQSSGKFVLLDKLLPKLKADGHRVLLFSQFTKVLDLMEDFFEARAFSFERLDGNLMGSARQQAIDRFSKPDSDRFVFLLCTRAGGVGINLTAADTVIIHDLDWNPQLARQAEDRAHRLGQKRTVSVYRLVTANSVEESILTMQRRKRGCACRVDARARALQAKHERHPTSCRRHVVAGHSIY